MKYICLSCKKVIGKEDKRRRTGEQLVCLSGATIMIRNNEAPRLRCICGHSTILLKGTL